VLSREVWVAGREVVDEVVRTELLELKEHVPRCRLDIRRGSCSRRRTKALCPSCGALGERLELRCRCVPKRFGTAGTRADRVSAPRADRAAAPMRASGPSELEWWWCPAPRPGRSRPIIGAPSSRRSRIVPAGGLPSSREGPSARRGPPSGARPPARLDFRRSPTAHRGAAEEPPHRHSGVPLERRRLERLKLKHCAVRAAHHTKSWCRVGVSVRSIDLHIEHGVDLPRRCPLESLSLPLVHYGRGAQCAQCATAA
jgi:hypothetical protein